MSKEEKERDPKERDEKGQLVKGHQLRVQSGAWVWMQKGKIPSIRGKRRIQRELLELRRRLMEAVPDSEDIRKQVLIGQIISSQGFVLLIESFLKRFGIMDPKAFGEGKLEVQGSLSYVISFLNVQARAIGQLGLDSKALDEIKAPYEIIAEQEKPK